MKNSNLLLNSIASILMLIALGLAVIIGNQLSKKIANRMHINYDLYTIFPE